jgi:hypothetical protein
MMRNTWILLAVILLIVPHAAQADTIELSVNTSFVASFYSQTDNFNGTYSTADPTYPIRSTINANFEVTTDFSNVSVFVPAGSVITSVLEMVIVPTGEIQGTGTSFPAGPLLAPDPGPNIAPTFGPGYSEIYASWYATLYRPIIDGDEVSTGDLTLAFFIDGQIIGVLDSPGSNWASYIGASGTAVIPYTFDVDVTYTPAPEPWSFVLLGTGLLGLVQSMRRRTQQRLPAS